MGADYQRLYALSSKKIAYKKIKILTNVKRFFTIAAMEINIKKIEREMERLNLTRYGLALKLGMKPYNLQYIFEKKQTKLPTIQKIADYLMVDARDLLI